MSSFTDQITITSFQLEKKQLQSFKYKDFIEWLSLNSNVPYILQSISIKNYHLLLNNIFTNKGHFTNTILKNYKLEDLTPTKDNRELYIQAFPYSDAIKGELSIVYCDPFDNDTRSFFYWLEDIPNILHHSEGMPFYCSSLTLSDIATEEELTISSNLSTINLYLPTPENKRHS